jgi:hypothetical protein
MNTAHLRSDFRKLGTKYPPNIPRGWKDVTVFFFIDADNTTKPREPTCEVI